MEEEQITITLPESSVRLLLEILETSEPFNKSLEIMRGNATIDLHQKIIGSLPQQKEDKKIVKRL